MHSVFAIRPRLQRGVSPDRLTCDAGDAIPAVIGQIIQSRHISSSSHAMVSRFNECTGRCGDVVGEPGNPAITLRQAFRNVHRRYRMRQSIPENKFHIN